VRLGGRLAPLPVTNPAPGLFGFPPLVRSPDRVSPVPRQRRYRTWAWCC